VKTSLTRTQIQFNNPKIRVNLTSATKQPFRQQLTQIKSSTLSRAITYKFSITLIIDLQQSTNYNLKK
jgi:hypothetical protein